MAATYQNIPRSTGRPPVQKPRAKKTTTQHAPSKITNTTDNIKIRFGNNSSQNSMYKPTSILKKSSQLRQRPYIDNFRSHILDIHQPTDLELIRSRPLYSPLRTPPRLRTLITPPGVVPYRNRHGLNPLNSPLPAIDSLHKPSVGLDNWDLNTIDHNVASSTNLIRPYPSPLSHSGLGSGLSRRKKPYIVVPRLNNLLSPPVSNYSSGTYLLPSRHRTSRYPSSHYEPSDYMFVKQNDAFANRYMDEFIGKYIQDQMIPDILTEVMDELDHEKEYDERYRLQLRRYNTELRKLMEQERPDEPLLSDHWVREYDYQRGVQPAYEGAYLRTANPLIYDDLPSDIQGRFLARKNRDLVDHEVHNMLQELNSQDLARRQRSEPNSSTTYYNMYDTSTRPFDDVQYNAVEHHAQSKLLDTTFLDQLIIKCIKQKGTALDTDDASRLLDGVLLRNLISRYQEIDANRSKHMNDYD